MTTFPVETYAHRIQQAQAAVARAGLDGLIIGTGAELALFTGSWMTSHERLTALVVPPTGTATFIAPAVDRGDVQASVIGELGVNIIGWEDGQDAHQLAIDALNSQQLPRSIAVSTAMTADHLLRFQQLMANGATIRLASEVLKSLMLSKDVAEIEQLRQAGAAIDRVHAQVPALLVAGRTEREVAADIEKMIFAEGHSAVDFIIVGSGPNGANPHHDFSDRVLEAGEPVVVDLGGTWGPGYHSDCTRTYVVGGPEQAIDPEFARLYAGLEEAQRAAVSAVRPGVSAQEIDVAARDIIAEAGYGEFFIHRTGHGIGLSTHEQPFIIAGNTLELIPGMAFSVEPGIYIPGKFGARIEDILVVTEEGTESLNNNPRSLR